MGKYECGCCLVMFDEHKGGTELCSLCSLCSLCLLNVNVEDNTYVHEDDYALEVETNLSV
jgi:hypothetical protein